MFQLSLSYRILSGPKARPILLNGAIRKGERLVPPSALEQLMLLTFPAPSARVKATERFEAIYPTLRELALAGSPGAKAMKPVSQQLLLASVKAMKENIPELSKEATDIFIWCLTQNPECFKQWEKLYIENVEASVAVLRKLSDKWSQYATKFSPPDFLRESLRNLRALNEEALSGNLDSSCQATIKLADKYCKAILGRLTRNSACMKTGLLVLTLAIAGGAFAVLPNMDSWDWEKLQVVFSSTTLLTMRRMEG
uniref:Transmembrane protein 214-A n=1 Tax=Anthurium amnicola TaxID=1678845 RepID=A0A1D1YG24_9ARAE